MIFETHAHYDDDRFKDDRDETIKRVHEKGVAPIINVGASIGSTMTTMELAKKYHVEMPIIEQVNEVLFEGKTPADAVKELMVRDKKIENWDFEW